MLFNTDVEVHVMELGDEYIPVYLAVGNTEEQRQFILDYDENLLGTGCAGLRSNYTHCCLRA